VTSYRAFASASPPSTGFVEDPVNLGVTFYVTERCTLDGILWWQAASGTDTSSRQARLYLVSDHSTVATATAAAPSGTGWQLMSFASPPTLAPNTQYRAGVFHPAGGYASTALFFDGSDVVNGPLVLPNALHTSDFAQGAFAYAGALAFPNSEFNRTSYWLDVQVTPTAATVTAPAAVAVADAPSVHVASSDRPWVVVRRQQVKARPWYLSTGTPSVVAAAPAVAVADAPAPTLHGSISLLVVPGTATADAPAAVVKGAARVVGVPGDATADAAAPVLIGRASVVVTAATATADAPAPVARGATRVLALVAAATADAPAAVLKGGGRAVSPAGAATADAPAALPRGRARVLAVAGTAAAAAITPLRVGTMRDITLTASLDPPRWTGVAA
jgi:hypothetical protein